MLIWAMGTYCIKLLFFFSDIYICFEAVFIAKKSQFF